MSEEMGVKDENTPRQGSLKVGVEGGSTLPGDPTEGRIPADVPQRAGADNQARFEEEMKAREAARGEGRAGAIGDVEIGTPAGASSDVLRNREPVPVEQDRMKGQQKDHRQVEERGGDRERRP
jgi:hypothetical protein